MKKKKNLYYHLVKPTRLINPKAICILIALISSLISTQAQDTIFGEEVEERPIVNTYKKILPYIKKAGTHILFLTVGYKTSRWLHTKKESMSREDLQQALTQNYQPIADQLQTLHTKIDKPANAKFDNSISKLEKNMKKEPQALSSKQFDAMIEQLEKMIQNYQQKLPPLQPVNLKHDIQATLSKFNQDLINENKALNNDFSKVIIGDLEKHLPKIMDQYLQDNLRNILDKALKELLPPILAYYAHNPLDTMHDMHTNYNFDQTQSMRTKKMPKRPQSAQSKLRLTGTKKSFSLTQQAMQFDHMVANSQMHTAMHAINNMRQMLQTHPGTMEPTQSIASTVTNRSQDDFYITTPRLKTPNLYNIQALFNQFDLPKSSSVMSSESPKHTVPSNQLQDKFQHLDTIESNQSLPPYSLRN